MSLSGSCKCDAPDGEANNAPPNPFAGFQGQLHGGGKRGEREGREGKEKWPDGMGEKYPQNKFPVTALVAHDCTLVRAISPREISELKRL